MTTKPNRNPFEKWAAETGNRICEYDRCRKEYRPAATQQKYCCHLCAVKAWNDKPKNKILRAEQSKRRHADNYVPKERRKEGPNGIRGEVKAKADPAELDKLMKLLPDGEFTYHEAMKHMNAGQVKTVLSLVNKLVTYERVERSGEGKFRRVDSHNEK